MPLALHIAIPSKSPSQNKKLESFPNVFREGKSLGGGVDIIDRVLKKLKGSY